VPIEEAAPGQESAAIASLEDLENLRAMLSEHFGGVTVLLPLMGFGMREAGKPETLELNKNLPFVVYSRPIAAADQYFERLQHELQESLGQGLILIERQEAFLLGHYSEVKRKALPGGIPTGLPER
jgi:PII-like signaling protein